MVICKAPWKLIAAIVVTATLGVFCWHNRGSIFFREFFVKSVRAKPSMASFVGRWKLEATSFPSIEHRMGKKPADSYLDIAQDGRLAAVNMPIENPFLKPEFQMLSGLGAWKVELNQDWVLTVIIMRGGGRDGYSLDIEWEGENPAALVYSVNDPDSNERWVWRKVP